MKGLSKSASDILQSAPEKCKESVFEPPILLQNQANPQILLHFQAKVTDSLQKSGARWSRCAHVGRAASGEKPRPLAALSHKKTRYPHEVDTGRKARFRS